MYLAIWDTKSRNLIADFDNEAEAYEVVRDEIEHSGIDGLSLEIREPGRRTVVLVGQELIARAQGAPAEQRHFASG